MTDFEKVMIHQMYMLNAHLSHILGQLKVLRTTYTYDKMSYMDAEELLAKEVVRNNNYYEDYLSDKENGMFEE